MSLLTKDTIEGLNRNPRTLLNGLEAAAKEKMLDYNDAIENNNEREAERLNAEINEIDERIVEVKSELGEESYEEMRKGNAEGGLTGNQTKLDMNKDGEISGEDFKLLRKADGGLLIDDRQRYGIGGKAAQEIAEKLRTIMAKRSKLEKEIDTENVSKKTEKKLKNDIKNLDEKAEKLNHEKFLEENKNRPLSKDYEYFEGMKNSDVIPHRETEKFLKDHGYTEGTVDDLTRIGMQNYELKYNDIGEIDSIIARENMGDKIDEKIFKNPKLLELARYMNYAEGGEVDKQMSMLMMPSDPEEDMLPDNQMEDEYLDFILDEALDSEEEDYLMEMLQGNERLSEIFDKVIDIAQEFAGSGPVEGPGSGVSDSIPARLSDGEFVFTAKAVDEIGADNLMAMMKDAEMKADDRQGLANGGEPEEEDTVEMEVEKPATKQDIRVVKTTVDNGGKGLLDEDEISKSIKSKMMLDNRTGRHVQS